MTFPPGSVRHGDPGGDLSERTVPRGGRVPVVSLRG